MNFDFEPEHHELRETVRGFLKRYVPKERMRELDRTEEFPEDIWQRMTEIGLHGVAIPEEYGGTGGTIVDQSIVAEELGRVMSGIAWMWAISSFAGNKAVGFFGTDEQKKCYLPRLAEGKIRFAFAVTEPGGGTDILGAMETFAREDGDGFVLSGQKIFCTGAHVSDYITLMARTKRPEDRKKRADGISIFIVDSKAAGVTIQNIPKLGMKCLHTCAVYLDDVFVPAEDLLGDKHGGWYQLTATMNNERILLSAICLGVAKAALEDATTYAEERRAFGRPIGQYQAIQHYIADIAMRIEQAELLVYKTAWLQSQGRPCAREAMMAKVITSELAAFAADRAIQILGGYGYCLEYDPQRYWRDVRIMQIGPVSNEMARNQIAESMGLPRSY